MNRIAEVFGTSPVLLPVVHPIGHDEALTAIRVAYDLGVKGVFLINQGNDVLQLVREVRDRYPTLWIGVNLLHRPPARALVFALDVCGTIDGIWADNAGINERQADGAPQHLAEAFVAARADAHWNGLYFGGLAFKYQREVASTDLGRAAALAAPYMDVICTSGPGTGYAADVDKVRALRAGLGVDHAMALASGVTPDNVRSYMPYIQAFLVGTGIEHKLGVFDPVKIESLLRAMQDGGEETP